MKIAHRRATPLIAALLFFAGPLCAGPVLETLQNSTDQAEQQKSAAPPTGGSGPLVTAEGTIFKADTEEVVLPVNVVDNNDQPIVNITPSNVWVYEDGHPRELKSFRQEEIPMAVGILIDGSCNRFVMHEAINQVLFNVIKEGKGDQVFVVDQMGQLYTDWTSDADRIYEAVRRVPMGDRFPNILAQSIIHAGQHLALSPLKKKILIIVSEGYLFQNAPDAIIDQIVSRLQVIEGPTVYVIGLPEGAGAEKKLRRIAVETGGIAYYPKEHGYSQQDHDEAEAVVKTIAHDIRTQYMAYFKPSRPFSEGGYRRLEVRVRCKSCRVRCRVGYTPKINGSN